MALPIPESLVAPRSAPGAQRAVVGVLAANSPPSPSDEGLNTRNHQYLHVLMEALTAGSFDVRMWVRYSRFGPWVVMTWFGTAGTASVVYNTPAAIEPALLAGIDRVYPEVLNFAGGAGANVWLAGSSFG